MSDSPVVSALIAKRAELLGLVKQHQKEIKRLRENILTLDESIKIFDPNYDVSTLKEKRCRYGNEYFYPREANRLILEVLREADEPLDTGEIAKRVAEKKGYTLEELDYTRYQTYLTTTLSRQRANGLIEQAKRMNLGRAILWRLPTQ